MKKAFVLAALFFSWAAFSQDYFSVSEGVKSVNSNYHALTGATIQVDPDTQYTNATLFVSEGDALDMRGNQLTHAFIDGKGISIDTHQTKLWKRYSEKYANQN